MSGDVCDFAELRRTSAPALLVERARRAPAEVAFRAKQRGRYRERTWADYARLVARTALALQALGLERGERLAIMGDPCEDWMVVDLAAQSLGAITYGIYPTAAVSEVAYQMRDGGAAVFVAETQEYVDKILPIADELPDLRAIVVIDGSAMFDYDHAQLRRLDALVADVPDDAALLDALATMTAAIAPRDPAFIVYTSGTTGHPKGALISHGKHLAGAATLVDTYPTLATTTHRTVVYLPLCHILGRDIAITVPLISRLVPHFGETIEDLPETLFETAPTVLFAVPRYLQKFAAQVLVTIGKTSPLKRIVYAAAMRLGRAAMARRWSGDHGLVTRALHGTARALAFRPMLQKLGLDQVALLLCGGAPLPAATMALWQVWGVNLVEAYGQTEGGGAFISGQPDRFPRPGDVGPAVRGTEIKLAADGEILLRSPDVFEGYWNQPDATDQVLRDGWLHTGDVGEWRDGALRLIDRARDFIVTAGGKTVSPAFIENILRASPYIAEAVVFGHGRKYLTAIVEIDYDTVADWARGRDLAYGGFTSLAASAEVVRLLQVEIDRANVELARVEQIKSFRVLPKMLDPEEEGEPVTPTRKVKRTLMYERFQELVESMYDDREARLIAEALSR